MSLIQDALKRKLEEEPFLPPKEKSPVPPAKAPAPPALKNKPASDSNHRRPLLVMLVALILIALGLYQLLRPDPDDGSTEPALPTPAVTAEPALPTSAVTAQPIKAPATIKPPPPVIGKEPAPQLGTPWPELSLTGFASGGTERLVIINGKMLSTGSRIDGVLILQIGNNEVAVEYRGEQRMLRVNDE